MARSDRWKLSVFMCFFDVFDVFSMFLMFFDVIFVGVFLLLTC